MGAADVYLVDPVESRRDKARGLGAIPIDPEVESPLRQIRQARERSQVREASRPGEDLLLQGVLSGIDAVGYQAHSYDNVTVERHQQVLEDLIHLTLPTGALGIIGVYLPQDPGGNNEDARLGTYPLPFGELWKKGLSVGTGQCPVKMYNALLRDAILSGEANPGTIVSHHIMIDQAPKMYERFNNREKGVIKVVITFK